MQPSQPPRRRPSVLYGNARYDGNGASAEQYLSADINLVATGVSKDATSDQLKEFLESNGIKVTDIELLTNFPDEVRSFTYRVAIKPEDFEKALTPDVWPYRVGVRHYKNK